MLRAKACSLTVILPLCTLSTICEQEKAMAAVEVTVLDIRVSTFAERNCPVISSTTYCKLIVYYKKTMFEGNLKLLSFGIFYEVLLGRFY
jgi:hypothetical protein